MRRFSLFFAVFALISVAALSAGSSKAREVSAPFVSPNIVISQIYGGGGNVAGSQFTHDFVELFNRGDQPVSLSGWSTQYASATGTNWLVTPLSNVTLQPGQYYLIQYASGGVNGAALPAPDVIAPPVTVGANTFIPNLSGTTGKLAVVNTTTQLPADPCPVSAAIVDLVGYGTGASCFEGNAAPGLSNTTAAKRNANGCSDTDNNASDFPSPPSPSPRNTASPANTCNLGGTLQAGITANPNNLTPPATTLLTVTVIPATTPPSTNITVVGNLSDIGGSSNQTFFDDGTNGDVTPGDNVFSYLATVPAGTSGGVKIVVAVAADAQGRSATVIQNITINGPLPNDDPLIFGNPSNATSNVADENNYLIQRPQYSLSYNRSKNTPNWVAWRLDSSWIGSANNGEFAPDTTLPAGWYRVTPEDYAEPVYDRGHMCPSGDRTRTQVDNTATYLMTNIIPQLPANNQGPWVDFENYCRTLASQGNEIYIITGPSGNIGTIGATPQNRVVIPAVTWKVVLVIPNGSNDVTRASSKATRVLGVIMSNQTISQSAPWRNFRVTVDAVEQLTGYNFFSAIPRSTQEIIEKRRDRL